MKLTQLLSEVGTSSTSMKKMEMKKELGSSEIPQPRSSSSSSDALLAIGGCRRCEKTFTDRLDLIHHFVDHFPTIFYSFETSKEPNSQLLSTIFSQCVKEKEKEKMEGSEEAEDQEDLPYHMCPHCCLTFLETRCFEDHLSTHVHGNPSESKSTCDVCGLQCNNEYLLNEHRKMHSKKCDMCNETFTTIFDLNLHVGEHFDYPYNCKDCGKCFPTRKSLAEHNKLHRIVENIEDDGGMKPQSSRNMNVSTSHHSYGGNKSKKMKNTQKPEHIERPESLLNSNPYFKALSKEPCRKRRSRASKTLKSAFVKKEKAGSNDNAFKMMVDLSNKLLQQLMGQDENAQQLLQMMHNTEKPMNEVRMAK